VDFLNKEAMEKVISRSEEEFEGRRLLIKNAQNFEGRPTHTKQRYQVRQTTAKESNNLQNDDVKDGEKDQAIEGPRVDANLKVGEEAKEYEGMIL
jgi:hypothetical protein